MRRARWLFLLPLLVQPACPSSECVSLDPNVPTAAIECQAGHLCYQGNCIQACTAGQELAQACTGDGDCDRTRPTCNQGFCSACDEGLVCIPTLNICRELTGGIEPPPPAPPGQPPPAALDGGWVDGGIKVGQDAGEPMPPERIVTHAGLIDVAQIDDGALRSEVGVEIRYVGDVMDPDLDWYIDPPSPPATETILERAGDCVLSSLTTYSASIAFPPANVGDIEIFAPMEFAGSITTTIAIRWNGTGYQVPNVPADLLRYSREGTPSFIRIESAGSPITRGRWPDPMPANGEHVPFEMIPSAATEMLLASGALVEIGPDGAVADDLLFSWSRVSFVNFESGTLRIRSGDHALLCTTMEEMDPMEPETIMIVPRDLLASFALRAGLAETTLPLHLERSFTRRLEILPAGDQIIDVAIRIRHTIESTIRFDQR